MSDAIERLVNLMLYLADARAPKSAEQIRSEVAGYPAEQDEAAFLRMFERDKKDLRDAGFVIETVDELGRYVLDRDATFASTVELSSAESAAIRAAGAALLADPSFPRREDLRLALAKIASDTQGLDEVAVAHLADEEPGRQGALVSRLTDAASRGKRVSFGYTNSYGATAPHELEPYGLFLHDGRWYVVGRDTARDEVRTYAGARVGDLEVDPARPQTRDFERPAEFDVRSYVVLPFQYGPADREFAATLRFEPSAAWRADSLTARKGELEPLADGGVRWTVSARDTRRLARFVLEHGPGLVAEGPPELRDEIARGLSEVVRIHG